MRFLTRSISARHLVRVVAVSDLVLLVLAAIVNGVAGIAANVIDEAFFLLFPLLALVILRSRRSVAVAGCFAAAASLNGIEKLGDGLYNLGASRGWAEPVLRVAVGAANVAWFPSLFVLVTVTLLRFPEGRLLSPRWRWAERAAVGGMMIWAVSLAAAAATVPPAVMATATEPVPPPGWARILFRIGEPMFEVLVLCTVAAFASVVVRFRRGGPVEREQTKWVLAAAAVAAAAELTFQVRTFVVGPGHIPFWVVDAGEGVAFGLIGVATAVAVLRYRLFEIDRIVSRTVTYGLVLAVLLGVYVGVVTGSAALVPARYGQVGVAVATLLVSVLAVPLTRRMRRFIDRRFDRSRFDAERVVTAFASRLRARPERGDVPADLLEVVHRTVAPAHAGVWVVSR